jgi:hypothetical protein
MKYITTLCLVALFISSCKTIFEEEGLDRLIGKYPGVEYFNNSLVKQKLNDYLPRELQKRIRKKFTVVNPISKFKHYVVAHGCNPHNCPNEKYSIFISSFDNWTYICISNKNTMYWYGETGPVTPYPARVKNPVDTCRPKGMETEYLLAMFRRAS